MSGFPKEHDPITERIIGAAIEVHRLLGPGLLESIYEEALEVELDLRGLKVERQVERDVHYKGRTIKGLRLDLVVDGSVVVELKSVARTPDVAKAQVLSYLKATGLRRGLLINFGLPTLVEGITRLSLGSIS
ncbi:MAG: GxxExxY protein [Gemmataceae bacterium]|nr:GxxExxY protein [Gemmataceae bacterium]